MRGTIILFIIYFLVSCNSRYSQLTEYYNEESNIHHKLASDLITLASKYKTDFIIRKWQDNKQTIAFMVHVAVNNEYLAIEFDSSLFRIDQHPIKTSSLVIPLEIIREFKRTPYSAIKANEDQVFFGDKYSSDGNSQYGILITNKMLEQRDYIMMIDSSTYIYKTVIP